jgi:hypothetical protein
VKLISRRCATVGLATYNLVCDSGTRLSSTSSHHQVTTSVGIKIGRVDGIRKFVLRIGHIGLGLKRHDARESSINSSVPLDESFLKRCSVAR